jgi:hypothetical protein
MVKGINATVHLMAMKMLTIRFWHKTLQHRMNRQLREKTVGASVRGYVSAGCNS